MGAPAYSPLVSLVTSLLKHNYVRFFFRTETTVGLIAAAILFFAMGILLCCCWSKCPLAQRKKRRQMQTSDVPYPGTHPPLTQSSQGDHNCAN